MIEKLSVLIITKNAASTLSATLKSVEGFARETIVIDDYSTDTTLEIAQHFHCKIIRNPFVNFGQQRSFALAQVVTEWTLVLDSDEVLTDENKKEILNTVLHGSHEGYYLRFRNHLFGKKLVHGELHKKLVLFKTKNASSPYQLIHEQYVVQGTVGELKSEVLHFSYRSVAQIISKFFQYAIRQAQQYKIDKKVYGLRELFLNPIHMFYARFIIDQGYKDGLARLFLDAAFAKMEFLSYALIPFIRSGEAISIDCGSCVVDGQVQSGIDRLIQGIYMGRSKTQTYYWFGFAKNSPNRLPSRFFSSFWLPLATLFHLCDTFFGIAGTIPPLLGFFPIKKVLFLYDFGFFSSPEKYKGSAQRLQNQTERSMKIADKIVVLNEEIYKELSDRYPTLSYKAHLIPAGADHLVAIKEKPVFIQEAKPMVLFVGVVKPVKRLDILLSVVGNNYCVIAGPQEKEYMHTLNVKPGQHIQFIQNLNDGQLKWLYTHADVMVYPSEHEGFCYPVLEALSLGVPVIAFDLPIFKTYLPFFPQLTLVKTESEMKQVLKKILEKKDEKKLRGTLHPYQWKTFNHKLNLLCKPRQIRAIKIPKIAFIVVLYKTPETEKTRIKQDIHNLQLPLYKIFWIDNTDSNRGYAAGVNEGIRQGLIDSCDYFFALNPDVSLRSLISETLLFVVQMFDVWGYTMRQGERVFYGGKIDPWRLSGGLITEHPKERFTSVDFVTGSLIGFSKEVVQIVGFWNEEYFMYYEDVDYCVRARKAGFLVGIDSYAVYSHYELSQTNNKKKEWIDKSRWKFFWNYANILQKIREVIRAPKTYWEANNKTI